MAAQSIIILTVELCSTFIFYHSIQLRDNYEAD